MYCSESETRITTDLPAVFDELLQSAHGDFSYIKKTLINLVVLTYRFAESYINSSENEYDAIEHLFRCESMETLSKELFPC